MTEAPSVQPIIKASFQDVLTPAATRSLVILKGMQTESVAQAAAVSEKELAAWMEGTQPILPITSMKRLQAVLGVEHGRLSPDQRHFFDIKPGKPGKKALYALSSLFPGGQIHQIVGPSSEIAAGKISVYVLARPAENAWLLIRHKKGWMGKAIDEKDLPGLHWGRQTREQSRIPISEEMSRQLEQNTVADALIDAIYEVAARNIGAKSWKPPSVSIKS